MPKFRVYSVMWFNPKNEESFGLRNYETEDKFNNYLRYLKNQYGNKIIVHTLITDF